MSDDMRYLSIMTNDNSINIVCHAGGKKKSLQGSTQMDKVTHKYSN